MEKPHESRDVTVWYADIWSRYEDIHTDTLLGADFTSSSWYVKTFVLLKSGVHVILQNVDGYTNKINILEKYWALVFPDMK